jgi:peptide/nickel transport system substrate-binding protein
LSAVVEKAATLTDEAERARLYRQAEKMVSDNVDRVFIAHGATQLILHDEVSGYIPNPTMSEMYRYVVIGG